MTKKNKDALCDHIREYAKLKDIYILNINGWLDHLHCLISLKTEQNIATVMNLIKGESAFWANKNLQWPEHFGWQDEYFAVSVSQSHCDVVYNYIAKQEAHHRKKPFQDEYNEFIEKYPFE